MTEVRDKPDLLSAWGTTAEKTKFTKTGNAPKTGRSPETGNKNSRRNGDPSPSKADCQKAGRKNRMETSVLKNRKFPHPPGFVKIPVRTF